MKLHLVSLGCARNLVDSEIMLGRLKHSGWALTEDPAEAETIIVNTCSFIESAVNESIDTILELAAFKKNGSCRKLIVAGCLPERYREEIVGALPEVDMFLGTGAYDRIVQAVDGTLASPGCILPDPNLAVLQTHDIPRIQSAAHTAYIKIAEGCDRRCTYCIIPKLRGKQKSRPPGSIAAEARRLIQAGVKELNLVAQDTTAYGQDLNPPTDLSRLLAEVAALSQRVWIRVLYGHPESVRPDIIQTIADHPNICSYFDIPIQHADNRVLKRMGRSYNSDDLKRLFEKIRKLCPEAALRTTVIVGFPGETDKAFMTLLDLVKHVRFDHLGVFTYSDSQDIPSHRLSGHVSAQKAQDRFDQLMSCQVEISYRNNLKYIGKTCQVLVEEKQPDKTVVGRTAFQAPEVDGITHIRGGGVKSGSFRNVRITGAQDYDLIGETV
ncbi:MAG: 30S ribosomal protein S12 methylthiotransferase RimO [Thermodesulfobacteriota bacterium]